MIELECPMCETVLLLAPTAEELRCHGCAITVALSDDDERLPLALAA